MTCLRSTLTRWFLVGLILGLVPTVRTNAQDDADAADDEAKQTQIAERFLGVLEKNPRRGTALDRVYGYHVEFGTLDKFLDGLREKVKKSPDDGAAWMLLGLFESHRGEDGKAVEAFQKAEEFRPTDALAPYYLGQSLLLVGQPEQAVEAFEKAISRNPQRNDLLEIFQQLGRVHQRAQRADQALEVWKRLESLFPNDPRVQEQIAVTLVEEGQYALALPRYEQLVKLVRDDYRRTMFQIEVAELKIRQNQRDDGLKDLEDILANLNPDSWLHHDVRRRMEEVFLRTGDQDGLVKYYEKWTERHPEDVDAMARMAKFLASSARVLEATQWMEKALKLAPKRTELRRAFIEQLVDDQRYTEAIAQYALLSKSDPSNSDMLRDWGKLVLRDKAEDIEKRKAEATRIWREMVTAHPKDAVTVAQVADLFRQANINEEAIALYQKSIDLAPEEPQYREYLGEFFHVLKRPEEALATWKAIAEGPRRTAANVARLAEVFNSFGYSKESTAAIAEACKLDPKDFSLELTAADYHNRAEKYDDAMTFIAAAEKLAANDDERESVMKSRIEALQSSRQLDEEIARMAEKVHDDKSATTQDWLVLSRYYEADRQWNEATETIGKALAMDAKSIPALATAARIAELSGDFSRAAEMSRQLAQTDRRSRSDHLQNVARLESQMGRTEEALKAGKELIASAPGNTDNYEFFAQLCFRLGKPDEGLDALRKAARINPTEPHLTTALGAALADQFRADEAIEVYWRAFDRTEEVEDKTSLTTKLTELYLQTNQFDKLIERFERARQEDEKRREMTICLAQAYNTSGDYGTARREMESLLNQETQDTNLLQQLSKLCEQGSDVDAAIDYQRRLAQIAPGPETEFRLAGLLQTRGDRDEASEILVKLTQREEDPSRLLRSIDSLLTQTNYESVIAITEPRLSQQRDDWELLYREIVAWASLEKQQEAKDRCQRLLAIKIPHDTLGVTAAEKLKQAQKKAKSDALRGISAQAPKRQTPMAMLGMASQVRQATGLDAERYYYGGNGPQRTWTPESFGLARMAAFGWLLKFEQDDRAKDTSPKKDDEEKNSFADVLSKAASAKDAERETIYDWMYVEQLRGNNKSIYQISKQLAQAGGKEERQFFLSSLRLRSINPQQRVVSRAGNQAAKKDALSGDDLDLMLKCYEDAAKDDLSQEANAANMGGQIIYSTNGQMYVNVGGNWVQVSGVYGGSVFLGSILEELKLAGRDEKAKEMLDTVVSRAKSATELSSALSLLASQEKFEGLEPLYTKWVAAAKDAIAKAPVATSKQQGRQPANEPLARQVTFITDWMAKLGPDEENAQVLKILDSALDISIEQAKKRRLAQSTRAQGPRAQQQQYYNTRLSLKYGKEQIAANVEFPHPDQYVDQSTLMLLREVYEVFKRNDVLGDLPDHLRKRVANAKPDDLIYEQLMLGYVLWWNEEQEEAVTLLTTAAEKLQDDPSFRLGMASLHESLGDVDRALEIVESIAPRDQKLVQQRETMALQLAERLGDVDRARQAAERLFGLRLDNEAQLQLVARMRRLGLNEMAEAIISRVQRRSGNQTSSLATLMAMYQGQGKVDLAQQIAHTILRRTTSPISAMSSGARTSMRVRTQEDGTRTQALQLLQQTGALKEMTERLEKQLEESPNSPRLYEQLIEFYQAANTRDKVQALLEKAIAQRPEAVALRVQLAKQLEQNGKLKEACDQYLEVLKQKPAMLSEDFYQIRNTFNRAQRSRDLVKALEKINLQSMSQPYYLIDLVAELLQDRPGQTKEKEDDTEIALQLFERVFDAFPQYRNMLVSRIYNDKLWKNDRVYALAKRGIIPSATEVAQQPWYGLESIYSYSQGGQVNAMFHQLLGGINGTDKVADLRTAIEAARKENPGWHGGEAMLALIELKQNKKAEAKTRLEKLVEAEEVLKSMPPDACWIVGQELDQFEDTRSLALKLFESAVTSDQRNRNQLQYSPVSRLVKLYGKINRKEEARKLLQKQLRDNTGDEYDVQYSSYMKAENSIWAAGQYLELGAAVDAVRLYRELIDSDSLEQAGAWYGNRPDYFSNQAQNGLKKALASIKDVDAEEAIKQLLAPAGDVSPDHPVLDLMVSAPDAKTVRTQNLDSSLSKLLSTISQNTKVATEIDTRLAKLASEHPDDFSVPIALAVFRQQSKNEHATETLDELAKMVDAKPLDEIPAGRRPNSRQRREAFLRVPLWLVAREYVIKGDKKDEANKLAMQALEAARRQVDNKAFVSILYDWGKLAADAGDRETAEQKWTELLSAVTKRPERREQPSRELQRGKAAPMPAAPPKPVPTGGAQLNIRGNTNHELVGSLPGISWFAFLAPPTPSAGPTPAAAGPSPAPAEAVPPASPRGLGAGTTATTNKPTAADGIPPLTISQFRMATEIALAAAENGMPKLSQSAVQKAMAGGIPVPDPEKAAPNRRGMVVRAATPFGQQAAEDSSPTEAEVASTLRHILEKWRGDDYSPAIVYELLHPIVLPVSRPADILLYADSSQIREAQAISLGSTLVDWAARAEKLADLSDRVSARKKNPQAQVPAMVLQTLIDLKAKKLEAARADLEELSKAVEGAAPSQMVQIACLAAIPASERTELQEPAFRILQAAVRELSQRNSGNGELSLGGIVGKVNRHLAKEPDKVKTFFDTFLAGRQAHYARYGGDYGLYIQWQDWALVANEAARAGTPTVALDYMGRATDYTHQNYSRPSLTTALARSIRLLRALPAQERYDAWRDWTLPAKTRQTVRVLAEWTEPTTAPDIFIPKEQLKSLDRSETLACNLIELIDSAEKAGKLEELREQAGAAFEQKISGANILQALLHIRANEPKPVEAIVADLAKTLPDRLKKNSNQVSTVVWGDYLVYRECLQSPEFASLAEKLRGPLTSALRGSDTLVHMSNDRLLRTATDTGATYRPGSPSGFQHWLAVSPRDITSSLKPSWLLHEGDVTHLPGPGGDTLQFKYPITGDFQFSADCFDGGTTDGELGYGGMIVESHPPVTISTLSSHESLRRPNAQRRPGYNRVEIHLTGGKLKYFVNNALAYEEDASPTSPWPLLYAHGPRMSVFKNIAITGNPVIPREVPLFSGNRMDGWNCAFFGETQPRLRIMAEKPKDEGDYINQDQNNEPSEHDWQVRDGELAGRSDANLSEYRQCWLYYQRPLCEQETFSYEFFYAPGTQMTHPSVGRLAFLLEPDGVNLHWIGNPNWDDAVIGIVTENRVTEADCRRGPAKLPLKENDWNKVSVKLNGDKVSIALNDTEVYERPLEAANQRLFGLFHDKRRAAKVRKAVLSGPWPEQFNSELQGSLIANSEQHSDADRRLISGLLADVFAEHDISKVVDHAKSLSNADRLEFLKQWVLPAADHANVRLYYQFAPIAKTKAEETALAALPHDGLICPAVDLIDTAAKANKLAELRQQISDLKPANDLEKRGQLALLAIASMKQGDDEAVRKLMTELDALVNRKLPKETPIRERVPEFVVGWLATEGPALRFAALDLAQRLVDVDRDKKFDSGNIVWRRNINTMLGRAESALLWSADDLHSAHPRELKQWSVVGDRHPDIKSQGARPYQWDSASGLAQYRTVGAWSRMYFQSPLRGKFEIICEHTTGNNNVLAATYGGHAVTPLEDLKSKRIITMPRDVRSANAELKIPNWGSIADFRMVVDDTKVTTFVNGVQVHEEFVTPGPGPWVVLHSNYVGNNSTLQNLRIVGKPEIPAEIDLIDTMSAPFWQTDLYGESVSYDGKDENAVWRRAGEELIGELRKDKSAQPLESILAYQRPILEDGTIEFEISYAPGEFEVHPVVGRTAFVLHPDGVKLHTMTDASWESSGLKPDNESAIEGAAESVPLKPSDWNKVSLTLKGDVLTLAVNGKEVAKHTLAEPPAERFFGLFRYADKTQCRVRRLVYRGGWPKELPDLAHQELAFPKGGPLADATSKATDTTDLAFSKPQKDLEQQGITAKDETGVKFSDSGVAIEVAKPTEAEKPVGVLLKRRIEGDCDVVVDFDDLQLAPNTSKAPRGFALRMKFDGKDAAPELCAEIAIIATKDGKQSLAANLFHRGLDGSLSSDPQQITGDWKAGRFRIVRHEGLVHCLFAEKKSDDFRLLATYPAGYAPISEFEVVGYSNGESPADGDKPLVRAVAEKLVVRTLGTTDSAARSATASKDKAIK